LHPGFCVRPRYGAGLLDEARTALADARVGAAVREGLAEYLAEWGIPRAWLPSLLSLFLIQRSLERDALGGDRAEGQWADLLWLFWDRSWGIECERKQPINTRNGKHACAC